MRQIIWGFLFAATSVVVDAGPAVVNLSSGDSAPLTHASTGKLGLPVRLFFSSAHKNGLATYGFQAGGQKQQGHGVFMPTGITARLVDLDFDGWADLWVMGCLDGQCRAAQSEIWRYEPKQQHYVWHAQLSAIPNLEVDPQAQLLAGGLHNCGCAAGCFQLDTYAWKQGQLQVVARRKQECSAEPHAGWVYQEWILSGGQLQAKPPQVITEPEYSSGYAQRSQPLAHPLSWD